MTMFPPGGFSPEQDPEERLCVTEQAMAWYCDMMLLLRAAGAVALVVLILSVLMGATPVHAEELKPAKLSIFESKSDCEVAMASGNFTFYQPKHFGLKNRNTTNGTTRVVVELESDQCRNVLVVSGMKWIPEKKGTKKRANKAADGSVVIYARDDCGNDDITDQQQAPSAPASVVAQAPPAPAVQPPAPTTASPVSGTPSVAPQPVVVHNHPCVNSLEVLDKLREKSKKKDATVNCTPDGGVQITWEEHKKKSGPGFWSSFWNAPMGVPMYGNMGGGVYGGQIYGHPAQNYNYSTAQEIRPYVGGGVLPPCGGGCGNPAVRGGAN